MIWRQNVQNFWVRSQNYKSNQITMERIDLTSKQSKMSSYVVKHSKLRKTQNYKSNQIRINLHRFDVKTYQKCWVTSQIIQNNAKLRKSSNYNELHRFDVKNIKPTQNYKSDLISMNCIDLMSKRSKHLS